MKNKISLLALSATLALSGCQMHSKDQVMMSHESQVQLRQIQTRAFDTKDEHKALTTAISTLQDLGFVIDKADSALGSISATKLAGAHTFSKGYKLRMTVTIRPRGESQILVRANAQYEQTAVEDPKPYQQFFIAFSKAMFLTAHNVD